MNCQPRPEEPLSALSGPCFVDRHDECRTWQEEHRHVLNIWGVAGCECQLHLDNPPTRAIAE